MKYCNLFLSSYTAPNFLQNWKRGSLLAPSHFNPNLYGLLTTPRYMGGGAESARSKRMASEVNWGHWGYHQGQILFLTSFPICRTLEQPPVLHTLAVMDRRSHLVSSRKIISVSACEIPNFANFWAIWTIWASNQSWKCSEFKFDMKKYNLLWKIRCTSEFFIFCIGKVADLPTLATRCG